jgi:hypothetical protein
MTATGHALIGAAIATKISNPLLALPLILVSHLLGDKLPHWDAMVNHNGRGQAEIISQTVIDVLLSFSLVLGIFVWYGKMDPAYMFIAAFVSQLPDWLEIPHLFTDKKFWFSEISYKIQKWFHDIWFDSRLEAPWGILTQAAVVLIFLWWAFT